MSSNTNPVLGVVILMRHGDREGYYQSPVTYTSTGTVITPLGEQQTFATGVFHKARYLNATSPNNIPSLANLTNTGLFNNNAVDVIGDAGGEGTTIMDSVAATMQGMFPATPASTMNLANGQNVTSPLNGYQYVAVNGINPRTNVSLESWTDCPAFDKHTSALYNSSEFERVGEEKADFLKSLVPLVADRAVNMANFYNVFDYINVHSIHNGSFLSTVSTQTLAQVRDLANYHEMVPLSLTPSSKGRFTDPAVDGIGNIAGRGILPQVVSTLKSFTNSSVKARMTYIGVAYKPFLSIMNMTQTSNQAYGIVNYAATVAFEVRQAMSGSGYELRMNFKNGTEAADYVPLNMFGSSSSDYPLDQFTSTLSPHLVSTLAEWCSACDNTESRGCAEVAEAALRTGGSPTTIYGKHAVSPVAAGFIGAGVTLALVTAVFGLLALVGLVGIGRKRGNGRVGSDAGSSARSLRNEKA